MTCCVNSFTLNELLLHIHSTMGSADRGIEIDDNEDDPIEASYDVYIKPQWQDGRKLYVLQFPNRPSREDYSSTNASLPIELRLKPKAGLVELDVPLDP